MFIKWKTLWICERMKNGIRHGSWDPIVTGSPIDATMNFFYKTLYFITNQNG